MSKAQTGADAEVRSRFSVEDYYLLPDGEYEYRVKLSADTKGKFVGLNAALEPMGLVPWLAGTDQEGILTLKRKVTRSPRRSRIPVILALLTASSILLFSLLEFTTDQQIAPTIPGYAAFLGSSIPVFAIVWARYRGHAVAARRAGGEPNSHYLLPGLPRITGVLPTLGFVSHQSAPTVNRDRYFDIMIFGPLAILLLSIALQVAGDLTAVQTSVSLPSCEKVTTSGTACLLNPSVIQLAIGYLLSPILPGFGSGSQFVSPIADGATVGFMLFFVSLLPMAPFDGGHVLSVLWGSGRARTATYVSVALLLALDTNEVLYWGIAIAVLLVAGRPMKLSFLDDVSQVSRTRVLIYMALLAIAFLAIPIPQDIATFPLG